MDKARILLVDDDLSVARSFARVLEVLGGYLVMTATDGRQVPATARAFKPDLVLLDVIAPSWDGGEVAAELEAAEDLSSIPVAFLTGLVDGHESQGQEVDSRGRRLIPKGVEPAELVDIVRDLLAGTVLRSRVSAQDRGRRALARILGGIGAAAKGNLTDPETAALADRLWADVRTVVDAAQVDLRDRTAAEHY